MHDQRSSVERLQAGWNRVLISILGEGRSPPPSMSCLGKPRDGYPAAIVRLSGSDLMFGMAQVGRLNEFNWV